MWHVLEEHQALKTRNGLEITIQKISIENRRETIEYDQVKLPNFVTILAFDEAGQAICLRQYKHGVGYVALTLPGGRIDRGETPLEAARREFTEETGYEAGQLKPLSHLVLHGAQRVAEAHHFFAKGCRPSKRPEGDTLEEAEIVLLSQETLRNHFLDGSFPIASHAAILGRYFSDL